MVGIVYWFIQNWPPSTFVTKQTLFKKKRSFKRKQYKKRNPLKGWFHKSFNPYITLSVQNNILLQRNGRAQNGWAKNFVFVKYSRKTFVVVPVEIKTITQLSCCPCVLQDESLARRCRFCETVNLAICMRLCRESSAKGWNHGSYVHHHHWVFVLLFHYFFFLLC